MVNEEHYARLKESVQGWNEWRLKNPEIIPDLSEADFSDTNFAKVDLSEADLNYANLHEANLHEANFSGANLSYASLYGADLGGANLGGANLSYATLSEANLRKTNFSRANIRGTDFTQADLSSANFEGVNFSRANLYEARLVCVNFSGFNLSRADLYGVNLYGANLIRANLSYANLAEAKLLHAKLSRVNLSNANLAWVNLSGLNLRRINLKEANLSKTQALGTDFTGAKFTGACLEDWNINSATKLNDIDCQYVYLKSDKQERRPASGSFAPGEFTKLFQKALETVDLIFADGIDWKAFLLSFQELQAEYGEENLSVQAIEKKSGGAFVIRLEVPPEANKADIETQAKALYEIKLNALEAIYHAKLQAKDEQIAEYRQSNTNLNNIIDLLATRPIQNIITVTANAENNSVSETFNNNFNQSNIANFSNKNQDDARQQANQNIYQSQQNQNIETHDSYTVSTFFYCITIINTAHENENFVVIRAGFQINNIQNVSGNFFI